SVVCGSAIIAAVRSLPTAKDVKAITGALQSFGIPTTRGGWRQVDSVLPIASLVGMFVGSILGSLAGERWYTRISRRVLVAEAAGAGDVDVRERRVATGGEGAAGLDEPNKGERYHRAQGQGIPGRAQMKKADAKAG